jgi:hypothetical protein
MFDESPVDNLAMEPFPYERMETNLGVWQRFAYPEGNTYAEFRSHQEWFGVPLVHFTRGICPETGRRKTARGIIAVGRIAIGVIALGQVAAGVIALGQVGVGLLLGLGQFTMGMVCIGQFALAGIFGLGQFTTGYVAIGQFALGEYVLAQLGFGSHVIDVGGADPVAVKFFEGLKP